MHDVHTSLNAGESYEQKELRDLIERIKNFHMRFGYAPTLFFCDGPGRAVPVDKTPAPVTSSDLAATERRILDAIGSRKPEHKPETQSPFIRRKEAIKLLGCRQTLERCEKAGWLTATIRRARLVQYKRADVMACVYRISQGEYP